MRKEKKKIRDDITNLEGAREEGKIEGKLEIAKKMLEEKIPIEMIIKITGLSNDEILKIQKS